jgi:hypothetical protein
MVRTSLTLPSDVTVRHWLEKPALLDHDSRRNRTLENDKYQIGFQDSEPYQGVQRRNTVFWITGKHISVDLEDRT